jgi:hypothetical protein
MIPAVNPLRIPLIVHVEPSVQVCPLTVVDGFAIPALVKAPEIAAVTFDAEGFAKLIVIPLTADPFWKFTGLVSVEPPFTLIATPPVVLRAGKVQGMTTIPMIPLPVYSSQHAAGFA